VFEGTELHYEKMFSGPVGGDDDSTDTSCAFRIRCPSSGEDIGDVQSATAKKLIITSHTATAKSRNCPTAKGVKDRDIEKLMEM